MPAATSRSCDTSAFRKVSRQQFAHCQNWQWLVWSSSGLLLRASTTWWLINSLALPALWNEAWSSSVATGKGRQWTGTCSCPLDSCHMLKKQTTWKIFLDWKNSGRIRHIFNKQQSSHAFISIFTTLHYILTIYFSTDLFAPLFLHHLLVFPSFFISSPMRLGVTA